mgnify:CR=1 FL=1
MAGPTPETETAAQQALEGLLRRLDGIAVTSAEPVEIDALLAAGCVVREVDTRLAGVLRVIRLDDLVLIAERSTKGQPFVRRMLDLDDATRFVGERLSTYERMWDGCGCRIDYLR